MRTDKRAVIFDVEGTLIDCVPQNLQSWQDALVDFGLTFPIEVLQLYSGMDGDEMLQILEPSMDSAARKQAKKRQDAYFKTKFLHRVRAFAGARDLLKALKAKGHAIALATDCAGEQLSHYRRLMSTDNLIDVISCGEEVDKGKPGAGLVALAIKKLGVRPNDAVMVGDTPYDAEAATSAGAGAIGVLTGGFARRALMEAGCHDVAPDLAGVGNLLLDQHATAAR